MIPSEDIVKLLEKYPRGLPSRSVARQFNVGNAVINGRLSKLAAYGIIKSQRVGPRSIYTAKAVSTTVEAVLAVVAEQRE